MCDGSGKCKDPQAVRQLEKETSQLRSDVRAKDLELRYEYGMNSIDANRTAALEHEIRELKAKIRSAAERLGVPPYCAG